MKKQRCEFEFHSWRGVLDATSCDLLKHFVEAKTLYCKICNTKSIIVMLSFVNHHGNRDDGFDPDFCLVGESVINVT
jgi:hypothetical protein